MPDRDVIADRVHTILDDAARRAYLNDSETERCIECHEEVDPSHAFSARDPQTGQRGYVCRACNMAEEWRQIPSYPDYEASDWGRVRRATEGRGTKRGRILNPVLDSSGYLITSFSGWRVRVHVLVAEAFLGPIPEGGQVHHRDENRANARLSNLEVKATQLAHQEEHRSPDSDLRREGESNPDIPCGCGCGVMLQKYDGQGRPRAFLHGHNFKSGDQA